MTQRDREREISLVSQDVGILRGLPASFQVDVCVGPLDEARALTQLRVCVCLCVTTYVRRGRVEEEWVTLWGDNQVFLFSCHVTWHPLHPLCVCVCVNACVNSVCLLQDFRDAVAKATRQNGKPVVDERILSQILYYLPQLYQLNRDLLRELEDRVAHWYFNFIVLLCCHCCT